MSESCRVVYLLLRKVVGRRDLLEVLLPSLPRLQAANMLRFGLHQRCEAVVLLTLPLVMLVIKPLR